MGCDIHLHTEVKINGKWHHYSKPNVQRNYRLFALMADVRNEDKEIKPISLPKGIPNDVSMVTQLAFLGEKPDAHHMSYLNSQELAKLEDRWEQINKVGLEEDLEHAYVGYLEGNSWAGFHKYPNDRIEWIEDVRWVFWFDN